MGGENEGWEEIMLGGGFINPTSHMTFGRHLECSCH